MVGNLQFELHNYAKHRRHLKKILNNTKSALHDVYRSGYFTNQQMTDLNLRIDDEEKIRDIIENSVGIVILGSKSWAKAIVVNELLGYALLPVTEMREFDPKNQPEPSSPLEGTTGLPQSVSQNSDFLSHQMKATASSLSHQTLLQQHQQQSPQDQRIRRKKSSSLTSSSGATSNGASFGLTSSSEVPNNIPSSDNEQQQQQQAIPPTKMLRQSSNQVASCLLPAPGVTSASATAFSSVPESCQAGGDNWRAIRLMYGSQTQVSLSVSNQYELVEHLAVYDRMWQQVPRSDLELNLNLWQETQSPNDPGYCSATLEIKLPHHLLSEDTQIIVAPTLSSGHVSFEMIYHTCFDGVSPVVIYALSDAESLTPQEVDDLMELQRISPQIPVFFIRTQRSPAPSVSTHHPIPDHLSMNSASELTESQQHLLFSCSHMNSMPANAASDAAGATSILMQQPHHNTSATTGGASSGLMLLQAGEQMEHKVTADMTEGGNKTSLAFTSQMLHQNSLSDSPSKSLPTPPSSTCTSPSLEFQTVTDFTNTTAATTTTTTLATPPTVMSIPGSAQWYGSATLFQQLTTLGFLSPIRITSTVSDSPSTMKRIRKSRLKDGIVFSELVENFDNFPSILTFIRQVLQSHLVRAANTLNALHNRCLRVFILTAFDMTRDMMITPKRISYAKEKEQQLYESLMAIANKKQEEIRQMISDTLTGMRADLLQEVAFYQFKSRYWATSVNNPIITSPSSSCCTASCEKTSIAAYYANHRNIGSSSMKRDYRLNGGSVGDSRSTIGSCSCSSSEETGVRSRLDPMVCNMGTGSSGAAAAPGVAFIPPIRPVSPRDYQSALNEIQDFVLSHLNAAIAGKLIGSVDCLRDSYVGTLERCLESLEKIIVESASGSESTPAGSSTGHLLHHKFNAGVGGRISPFLPPPHHQNSLHQNRIEASNALKSILNAAYQVEIDMKTTSSMLRVLWEKIKSVVSTSWLWAHQPVIDTEWKVRVASDMLDKLSESRLAKSICSQFRERLKLSHENFLSAIKQLESVHSVRLEKTEEHRLKVRKVYAPKIARYALESTSLRDLILHGMPQLGREIGRGQYGVVYACDSWAGHQPVALKSVVPPDDKHWNDLAMEFYYTRSIAEHERIVQIRGSVIDHSYSGGATPAVLLIMDRLTRDLYSAIKNGLDWLSRLQVAIDVVQGIRFLHSQGLVHRDIKLKNVLLDKRNRAKITDLGFCKPEAMMSGSIVGTPIHMAPELFSGKYDASVDVYAFGILFWYICAGHVRLPYIFEQCQNKDQLWTCVRKGSRPERLPVFDDDCWHIMEKCWAGSPCDRPLLGDVEPKLLQILEKYRYSKPTHHHSYQKLGRRLSGTPITHSHLHPHLHNNNGTTTNTRMMNQMQQQTSPYRIPGSVAHAVPTT